MDCSSKKMEKAAVEESSTASKTSPIDVRPTTNSPKKRRITDDTDNPPPLKRQVASWWKPDFLKTKSKERVIPASGSPFYEQLYGIKDTPVNTAYAPYFSSKSNTQRLDDSCDLEQELEALCVNPKQQESNFHHHHQCSLFPMVAAAGAASQSVTPSPVTFTNIPPSSEGGGKYRSITPMNKSAPRPRRSVNPMQQAIFVPPRMIIPPRSPSRGRFVSIREETEQHVTIFAPPRPRVIVPPHSPSRGRFMSIREEETEQDDSLSPFPLNMIDTSCSNFAELDTSLLTSDDDDEGEDQDKAFQYPPKLGPPSSPGTIQFLGGGAWEPANRHEIAHALGFDDDMSSSFSPNKQKCKKKQAKVASYPARRPQQQLQDVDLEEVIAEKGTLADDPKEIYFGPSTNTYEDDFPPVPRMEELGDTVESLLEPIVRLKPRSSSSRSKKTVMGTASSHLLMFQSSLPPPPSDKNN